MGVDVAGFLRRTALFSLLVVCSHAPAVGGAEDPYRSDVSEQVARLGSSSAAVRAGAAEALGFLRAYGAAGALRKRLADGSAVVRREATMALAWCGGRADVPSLLAALDDEDWTVRQAAWVSLTNLTGMEFPYDALAGEPPRRKQAKAWRDWWARVPADPPPKDVLDLLPAIPDPPPARKQPEGAKNLARGCDVAASTTYKGPPRALTDGRADRSRFWQTKNVPFPQHCTVDLGGPKTVGCVVVYQYGRGFCMTEYSLETSVDGKTWGAVHRRKGVTPPRLVVTFPPRRGRYVRITSHGTVNRTYPTTFLEVQVTAGPPPPPAPGAPTGGPRADEASLLRWERGLRALGALGGHGAARTVAKVIDPYRTRGPGSPAERSMALAGIRSLGRLGGPRSRETLVGLLRHPEWARYAADALGDLGGEKAAEALLAAYGEYALDAAGRGPQACPPDDRPGFSAADRMYETPYAIAAALSRLPLEGERLLGGLRRIAPALAANLVGDFDGAMLYEPEAAQRITAWLLERAGMRHAACEAAFAEFGQPASVPQTPAGRLLARLAKRSDSGVRYSAAWLPALCRSRRDVPRLIALLDHADGWVRINAAKALRFLGARRAAGPIARLLAASKTEAEHGTCGTFIKAEYKDPTPRWREAFVRALGRLGGPQHVSLLAGLLEDDRNVLEVQFAAAMALDELGGEEAIAALRRAEAGHPFHSVRLVAREGLWKRGIHDEDAVGSEEEAHGLRSVGMGGMRKRTGNGEIGAVVFIRGPNKMPNCFQIDIWRQTYSTTDSGPTYRVGRNLYILRPGPGGRAATPLTKFADGWVADCEVSWDGRRVLFARRGEDDPWWHVCEIDADGSGFRQITRGPYHHVQPAYLPDGRIVFSSSRTGMRDEYHGYYATGLTVMNADGGDVHCIGFNLGRDNEPAVLDDGRIVFSRLDLFYSRMKTELTVQAVHPDGTHNVTLYGPERRGLWQQVTRRSGEDWWGESGPRHRVLRLTQPQPFGRHRVLCATTGGLTLTGPSRYREHFLPHDRNLAVTSPFPLGDGRVLCAAAVKKRDPKTRRFVDPSDLGLYVMDTETGRMTLLYNDPATAEFEPRPIRPRRRPPVVVEAPRSRSYTARLFCNSARISRESRVGARGKLLRVVEGMPIVSRHGTDRNPGEVWRNHTGTLARVLGTVPLAADGSFLVDVPADRLIHLQVLDSDRRVVGNQLFWMYARPRETRSCVGCHEHPDTTSLRVRHPLAARMPPVKCLPTGGEFSYRAKAWRKGSLPDETEERTRTVRAVNLIGR